MGDGHRLVSDHQQPGRQCAGKHRQLEPDEAGYGHCGIGLAGDAREDRSEVRGGDGQRDDQKDQEHRHHDQQVEHPGAESATRIGQGTGSKRRSSQLGTLPGRRPPHPPRRARRIGRRSSMGRPGGTVPVAQTTTAVGVGIPVGRSRRAGQRFARPLSITIFDLREENGNALPIGDSADGLTQQAGHGHDLYLGR